MAASRSPARSAQADAVLDRDPLFDRLSQLAGAVPALAQELATTRREAARLRVENRRLTEELRVLRAQARDLR